MNPIETLKSSVYTTKHTQNTKLHLRFSHFVKIQLLQKQIFIQTIQRVMQIRIESFIIYVVQLLYIFLC